MASRSGHHVQNGYANVDARDYIAEESDDDDMEAVAPGLPWDHSEVASKPTVEANMDSQPEQDNKGSVMRGLETITSYLSSLEDLPCGIIDIAKARSYASYAARPSLNGHQTVDEDSVAQSSLLSVWTNRAFQDIIRHHGLTIDDFTTPSQAVFRGFLVDVADGRLPLKIKLEFAASSSPASANVSPDPGHEAVGEKVAVEFTVGKVAADGLRKKVRQRFAKGLLILHGSAVRKSPSPAAGQSKSVGKTQSDKSDSRVTTTSTGSGPNSRSKAKAYQRASSIVSTHDAQAVYLTGLNFHAFTRQPCLLPDTETGRLFRDFAWKDTPLGPVEHWPSRYIGYAVMVLSIPSPAYLALTPEYLQIYNDAFSTTLSLKEYSTTFGQPMGKAWGKTWSDTIKPCMSLEVELAKDIN